MQDNFAGMEAEKRIVNHRYKRMYEKVGKYLKDAGYPIKDKK